VVIRRRRLYHTRKIFFRIAVRSIARDALIRTSLIFASLAKGERRLLVIRLGDVPGGTKSKQKKEKPRRSGAFSLSTWRREPESNRPKRLYRPSLDYKNQSITDFNHLK